MILSKSGMSRHPALFPVLEGSSKYLTIKYDVNTRYYFLSGIPSLLRVFNINDIVFVLLPIVLVSFYSLDYL